MKLPKKKQTIGPDGLPANYTKYLRTDNTNLLQIFQKI